MRGGEGQVGVGRERGQKVNKTKIPPLLSVRSSSLFPLPAQRCAGVDRADVIGSPRPKKDQKRQAAIGSIAREYARANARVFVLRAFWAGRDLAAHGLGIVYSPLVATVAPTTDWGCSESRKGHGMLQGSNWGGQTTCLPTCLTLSIMQGRSYAEMTVGSVMSRLSAFLIHLRASNRQDQLRNRSRH